MCVAVTYAQRRTNRRRMDWYARARAAGLDVVCWSWFTTDPDVLAEAVAFAAGVEAKAFVINGEKELRRHHDTAHTLAATGRRVCDEHGLSLGLVSYSIPETVKDFPWETFAEVCDFGMPEIYDREGQYDPTYPPRAMRSWRHSKFQNSVPCCGVYTRKSLSPARFRWRTNAEIERHLALFDLDTAGTVCAWGLGNWPGRVLKAMGRL